jgi:hypothetical protein
LVCFSFSQLESEENLWKISFMKTFNIKPKSSLFLIEETPATHSNFSSTQILLRKNVRKSHLYIFSIRKFNPLMKEFQINTRENLQQHEMMLFFPICYCFIFIFISFFLIHKSFDSISNRLLMKSWNISIFNSRTVGIFTYRKILNRNQMK